jgi:enoyl-[acyl-carrier-protein] reductase (NADH)
LRLAIEQRHAANGSRHRDVLVRLDVDRVNGVVRGSLSGPLATRAASGIKDFSAMMDDPQAPASSGRLATIDDCGAMAAFLASDKAAAITGGLHCIDSGCSIMA